MNAIALVDAPVCNAVLLWSGTRDAEPESLTTTILPRSAASPVPVCTRASVMVASTGATVSIKIAGTSGRDGTIAGVGGSGSAGSGRRGKASTTGVASSSTIARTGSVTVEAVSL